MSNKNENISNKDKVLATLAGLGAVAAGYKYKQLRDAKSRSSVKNILKSVKLRKPLSNDEIIDTYNTLKKKHGAKKAQEIMSDYIKQSGIDKKASQLFMKLAANGYLDYSDKNL